MARMKFLVLIALCFFIYFNDEVKAECGGFIEATNGTISSPRYPSDYPPNQTCTWEIKIPPNNLWLHFKDFKLEGGVNCTNDYVRLKSKMEDGSVRVHGKYCGEQIHPNRFHFNDSSILQIEFQSDDSFQRKGFLLDFFTDCGGLVEKTYGNITTPFYPYNYPPDQNCTWEFKIPPNKSIWLYFKYFEIEKTVNCMSDYVSLKSKMKNGSVQDHGKYCGEQNNGKSFHFKDVTTLEIEFKSDHLDQNKGFELYYSISTTECGTITEETNGTIRSPLYPMNYPSNLNCTWKIKIPPNKSIWLHFKHFDLQSADYKSICAFDYVSLKSKMEDGSNVDHGKYCAAQIHGKSFHFTGSKILEIEFKSDFIGQYKGFELDFFTIPFECGEILEESEGIITSPLYPLPYPPDLNCTWIIQAPIKHNIKLTFTDFKTEESSKCDKEYVTVQSKMVDGEIRAHGKFCGGETPPVIVSDSNILLIQFVSYTITEHEGFKATYISGKLTDFESSISPVRSTTPLYEILTSTTVHQHDDIATEFVTSRKEEHTLSGKCGGLIEGGNGNISTPFFPDSYPPNKMCEWSFLVPPQHKMILYFLNFEIEEGGVDCSNDFLLIQSKTAEEEIKKLGKYCGASRPPTVFSKDNIMLKFVSDRSYQSKGFKAEYAIDKLTDYEVSTTLMKPIAPAYVPKSSTAENQKEIVERENATLRNETNIMSDVLTSLREEIASIKDTQKILLSNYEDLNKMMPLMMSKDGGKNSSNLIERKLFNDCGKFIFFLRRILNTEK